MKVPDLRGQFIRGWDHTAATDPGAASRTDRGDGTTGDYVGTKQAGDVIDHDHAGTTDSDAHTHNVQTRDGGVGTGVGDAAFNSGGNSISAAALSDAHTHTFTSDTDGHNTDNETRPINIPFDFTIICFFPVITVIYPSKSISAI